MKEEKSRKELEASSIKTAQRIAPIALLDALSLMEDVSFESSMSSL